MRRKIIPPVFCCKALAKEVARKQINHYGKKWNVFGCCGGQCYVLSDIKFCPFCGTKLLLNLREPK